MRDKIFFTILFLIFLASSLFFVFFGKIWTDENWYFSGSVMVSQGLHPFFDFFSHHNPLFVYIYSLPQYLFGPSFVVGRLTSFFFTILIFFLVYIILKRLASSFGVLLGLSLLTFNFFSTKWFVNISYHPLESSFILFFFFFLTSSIKDRYRYSLCTISLILYFGTRYLFDLTTIVFLTIFFVYLFFEKKCKFSVLITQILIALVSILLFIVSYSSIFKKFFFQAGVWNFIQAGKGMLPDYSFKTIIFHKLGIMGGVLDNFLPVLAIVFSATGFMIWLMLKDKEHFADFWKGNTVFSIMLMFVIVSELFYQIPVDGSSVIRLSYFPVACIVAGVFWGNVTSSIIDSRFKPAIYILPFVLILFSIITQHKLSNDIRPSWKTAHLNYLNKVSNYLKSNTPEDAEIFTFDPPFVVEADRKLSMNMLMEVWQVSPEMTKDECEKYGMVNIEMIIEELGEKRPYALVLKNPGRLEDNGGKGRILIPYRDIIWKAINDNYYLVHTIPMKIGVDPVVNIYYRLFK